MFGIDWLTSKLRANADDRGEASDFWFTPLGYPSSAGVRVSAETAMTISTFYAGVRAISESAAMLPLQIFERAPNGDKTPRPQHPLYDLLHDQPNDEHSALEWREMMTAWAVMRGTGVSEIIPGARGAVDQLIPLHPDHLSVVKVEDLQGRAQWQFVLKEPGAAPRRLLREELLIIRGLASNAECPLLGIDPISAQRHTLGAAQAAQDYTNRFWQNDARPSGIVKHPSYFQDEPSRDRWRRAFQRAFTGANRHKVALLEWGMEYQQISITPEQAQFIETRKWNAEDAARILRIPPHKVGLMEKATFSNIEQQSIEFVTDTMLPWLTRWEQAISRDLIQRPVFFAEHNVDALLRGDLKTRYEAYAIARNWGWFSVNDILRKENMNGIGPDGDVYLQPLNMREAGDFDEPSQQDPRPGLPRRPAGEPEPEEREAAGPTILTPGGQPARTNGAARHA